MRNFDKSIEWFEIAKSTLAGGVASSLRMAMKPVPLFLQEGQGSRIKDVDGNDYIDYIMGYGPLILGHSHPELLQFISKYISKGQQFGMQHWGEIELSKRIVDLIPCAEKVAFSGSGTEAVMLALRLSRAKTGRHKIIRFEGHYHGWSDSVFTSFATTGLTDSNQNSMAGTQGQSQCALQDIILLPWNDIQALENTLQQYGEEIAAIITEPIMCNSGCIRPHPGYLEMMRKLTEEKDIVLIFDEVITGYRISPGGAQEYLGITPDLTTMGKALAGGFQLSAVAGKKEIMDLISDGTVSHLGTLNGNIVSIGAGIATLDLLNRNNGIAYDHMNKIAAELVSGLTEVFEEKGIPLLINHVGPVFHLMFTTMREVVTFDQFNQRDTALYDRFAKELLQEGVVVRPNGLWYVSASHTEKDVEETLIIVKKTLGRIIQ